MNDLIVTCTVIWIMSLNLMKMTEFAVINTAGFIESVEWYNQLMIQHNLYIRVQTKLPQKLPKELENKIDLF